MDASPYLSDAVLTAMLKKNPALPPGHIKDIVLANSPLTPQVWQILQGLNLPNGIKNQIQQAQTGISQRRLLVADIQATENEALSLSNAIVRYYLDSAYIDSAVAYLTELGSTEARCAIVPICFQYGTDTATACAHLAAISQAADSLMQTADTLKGKKLRTFCDLYTLLFRVKYSEGGYFSLSTQDSLTLQGLIDVRSPMGVHAQNLFALVYGKEEELWAEPLNTGINARKAAEENPAIQNTASTLLKCYPNPFTGSTQIEVHLAEDETAVLQITDIMGKILKEVKVSGKALITLSESEVSPGIYLCRLLQNGSLLAKEKIVKVN